MPRSNMMTITPLRALIALLLASLVPTEIASGAVPKSWIKVGNEKQIVRDNATWNDATGREIRYLTSGEHRNAIFHPHCQSWSKDGRHIWFVSTRPRPAGPRIEGEVQLMAADTRTGDLYWLATLPGKNASRVHEAPYHADYNSITNTIIFTDMDGENLHALQLDTGAVTHLWKMDNSHIRPPLSISTDGRRVSFTACAKEEKAGHSSKPPAHTVYHLNLDETGTKPVGRPRMITPQSAPALWSTDGKWMYLVDNGNISRISADGKTTEPLSGHHKLRAKHISVSNDLKRIAYDVQNEDGLRDADGNVTRGEIWWFDVETKTPIKLAIATWNERLPSYANPKIAPDGSAVIFNASEGNGSRVAFILLPAPGQ